MDNRRYIIRCISRTFALYGVYDTVEKRYIGEWGSKGWVYGQLREVLSGGEIE